MILHLLLIILLLRLELPDAVVKWAVIICWTPQFTLVQYVLYHCTYYFLAVRWHTSFCWDAKISIENHQLQSIALRASSPSNASTVAFSVDYAAIKYHFFFIFIFHFLILHRIISQNIAHYTCYCTIIGAKYCTLSHYIGLSYSLHYTTPHYNTFTSIYTILHY